MNAAAILDWIKANVLIVVFGLLMVAAPIGMLIVSGGMNESIRKQVSTRAQKASDLTRLNAEYINPVGEPDTGIINEALLTKFTAISQVMSEDAKAVSKAALAHNRKQHDVVMPAVLPEMPAHLREILPLQFHEKLMASYEGLLTEIGAGSPPAPDSMKNDLERERRRFITQDLRKVPTDKLTSQEEQQLREQLKNLRMSKYTEGAKKMRVFASRDALNTPVYVQSKLPSIGELYAWQWQYWITEDILRALDKANASEPTVTTAPVKRVLSVSIRNIPTSADIRQTGDQSGSGDFGSSGGGGFAGSGGFAGGSSTPDGDTGEGGQAPPAAMPADPKAPIPSDFSRSLSGRVTNPLYDVINVDVKLIVETERLPEVFDALAGYNFMTVTGLQLSAVDPFEAAQNGFYYGSRPVSQVNMQIETIWLREWTKAFMPKSTRQMLGIPADLPAAESTEPSPAT